MGGRTRGCQNRSFHRRLLIATEPLTVVVTACPDSPRGTASGRPASGTSPLGVFEATPPVTRLAPS
jgi:hypothetical protein